MKVIGLAGRAGSGKSAVARCLAQRPGVVWVDLDAVAWETYAKGTPTYHKLMDIFGESILNSAGEIDRASLAKLAFDNREQWRALNAAVHPAVSEAVVSLIRTHRNEGAEVLLIEGALLASSPYVDRAVYDLILWLEVPEPVRAQRLHVAGRDAHAHRGDHVSPRFEVRTIDATGSVEDVAKRVTEAIDSVSV